MHLRLMSLASAVILLGMVAVAQDGPAAPQTPPTAPTERSAGRGTGQGRGRGGWGGAGYLEGRGVAGTVSEVAADHYTIKTSLGETYTVHYSANSHILKQPAQRPAPGAMRVPPEEIKASDIHVGDAIVAMGQVDATAKEVGALSVVKVDPERAREMREMQANFGKTWLMGHVTGVKETKVTLQSPVDNAEHTFVADENTSFRRRREPVTLAEIQVGSNVRVEGTVKEGVFIATAVSLMGPPAAGGPAPREGPPPQ